MSKELTLNKLNALAAGLTGKEAAKLVVKYLLKGEKEGTSYGSEIKTIVSNISPNQASEYSYYYHISLALGLLLLDLQTAYLHVQLANASLEKIHLGVFSLDLVVKPILISCRFIPKILTEADLETLYKKYREEELSRVMPINKVAEYETYHRLEKEGLFKGVDSYPEDIIDWLTGREKDEEAPTKEQIEKWNSVLVEEKEKLETLVKEDILKEAPVVEEFGWYHNSKGDGVKYKGTRGITSRSWYEYKDKQDKGLNEHINDRVGLVSWNDGELALALSEDSKRNSKDNPEICWGEYWRSSAIRLVEKIQPVKSDGKSLKFQEEEYKELVKHTVNRFHEEYQQFLNHRELILKLETDYFDGMQVLDREKSQLNESVIKEVKGYADAHNEIVNKVIDSHNDFHDDKKDKKTFEEINDYLVNLPEKADEKWLEENVEKVLEKVER